MPERALPDPMGAAVHAQHRPDQAGDLPARAGDVAPGARHVSPRPAEVVVVENLRKAFRLRGTRAEVVVAVDDVSFTIPARGSVGLVGESGSGKTTVGRILVGLEVPSAGSVTINGARRYPKDKRSRRRSFARDVQMVFQDPYSSLDRRQTVGDGLLELLRWHFDQTKDERHARMISLLQQVGLDERHAGSLPGRLSGGQRQRAAIARALALEPEVIVLDEATASLDVSIQAQVMNLLLEIREQTAIAYLFISHDLAVVRYMTDHLVVMQRGRVVEAGRTERVLEEPQTDYTKWLLDSVPRPGWKPRRRAKDQGCG
jgi:ABC-type oligopeptide transport system ATPase subunit